MVTGKTQISLKQILAKIILLTNEVNRLGQEHNYLLDGAKDL